MKPVKTLVSLTIAALAAGTATSAVRELIEAKNVDVHVTADSLLVVTADFVLDSLDLKSNRQVLITPVLLGPDSPEPSIADNGQRVTDNAKILPSVLVNGRNMHISYERGVLRSFPALRDHDIWKELQRRNGSRQTVEYTAKVGLEPWMREEGARVSFRYDPCGCGIASAPEIYDYLIPWEPERVPEIITRELLVLPEIDVPNVQVHAGRARIQFEVDRTALHVLPYTCRNGQLIDNRAQLKVIDDSVRYALSDPNVELVGIEICGYASPESPYLHNEELANGRSKALAEYLADLYSIPREKATYSAVVENWGEFRDMVESSEEITDLQRRQLLELIDAPATTPQEYDRKETILKTDPKFAKLYRELILPKWFPLLRATTFALQTQLKEMDDGKLAEVFRSTPEKMSLQQFCRVARLYPADSDEFHDVVMTALAFYPSDVTAVTNAAISEMAKGDYEAARKLLDRGEQTPAVFRLRGMMAESERSYDEAARYYSLAGDEEKAAECREKAKAKDKRLKIKD